MFWGGILCVVAQAIPLYTMHCFFFIRLSHTNYNNELCGSSRVEMVRNREPIGKSGVFFANSKQIEV